MKPALLACHAVVLMTTLIGYAAAQTQTRAATVFRCGADGRELRDSPCPNDPKAAGSQVEFDQPSAAQTREASGRAIAEAKRARALEEKRHRDEAEARRSASQAVGINGLAGPAAATNSAGAPKQPLPPKPPKSPKAPKLSKPQKPALSPNASPAGLPARAGSAPG